MTWLKPLAAFLGGLLKGFMSLLAAFLAGRLSEQKKQAENVAKQKEKEAQEFANTPVTRSDAARILQERAKRKDKARNKS